MTRDAAATEFPFVKAGCFFVAFVALLLAGTWGYFVFRPVPPAGVTPENFARLRKGMSLEQVQTILGGPGKEDPWVRAKRGSGFLAWSGPDCKVWIRFTDVAIDGVCITNDGIEQTGLRPTDFNEFLHIGR
jgi:hypothetical protein